MTEEHRQIERMAAAWLARRDAGGWSDRNQAQLNGWLDESVAHRVAFLRLEAAWEEAARLKALAAGDAHARIPAPGAWARSPYFATALDIDAAALRRRTAEGQPHARTARGRRRQALAYIAAGVAGAAILVAGLFYYSNYGRVDRAGWQTTFGAMRVVHLPDGSTATLGGRTALRIAFSHSRRDLQLARGEAFFDVAHDSARPFVVRANGYRVIAVGTRFDVRRSTGELRVVVTRGLVRLQSASDPQSPPAMLPAGSIALVDGGDVVIRHFQPDQMNEYLSWRSGHVVFHGTPLADAIEEFNRYNQRQIVIRDPSLDNLRVGGNFRLDNSEAFVRLMQEVFPLQASPDGDRIVLTRRSGAGLKKR
jgi:transmembrane sensor